MSGNTNGNYFEDDSPSGDFTVTLHEDPLRPGELKIDTTLNFTGLTLRAPLNKELALRLANALWGWYATDEMLADVAASETEGD